MSRESCRDFLCPKKIQLILHQPGRLPVVSLCADCLCQYLRRTAVAGAANLTVNDSRNLTPWVAQLESSKQNTGFDRREKTKRARARRRQVIFHQPNCADEGQARGGGRAGRTGRSHDRRGHKGQHRRCARARRRTYMNLFGRFSTSHLALSFVAVPHLTVGIP